MPRSRKPSFRHSGELKALLGLFGVRVVYRRVRRRRRVASVASQKGFLEHKSTALALVQTRIAFFNQHYGFTIGRVAIKNQQSRWGSCSKRGNLNFTYRLALLPSELSDYVIVHELCHLSEFNHSPAFWVRVAECVPDYRARRMTLKSLALQTR